MGDSGHAKEDMAEYGHATGLDTGGKHEEKEGGKAVAGDDIHCQCQDGVVDGIGP